MPHEHRKSILFINEIKECMELAAQIQNAEIATVFVSFHGHVNQLEVNVHYPYWTRGSSPGESISYCCHFDSDDSTEEEYKNERILPVINRLKEILVTSDQRKSDQEILEENERKQRLETFKKLQEEFGSLKECQLELQKAS